MIRMNHILWLFGLLFSQSGLTTDSFETATPQSQDMDAGILQAGVDKISNGSYGDIDSLIVLRNGHVVVEKYFNPDYYGREYRYTIRSITKSFTSALVGIAIGQGKIKGVETNIMKFFPQYLSVGNPDPRKTQITLHDVLSMSAGFEWDEMIRHYGDPQNSYNQMIASDDWIGHVLGRPMRDDPGTRLEYSGGCSMLLSAVLQRTTGQTAEDFAAEYLFKPLGIDDFTWLQAQGGLTNGAGGISMRRIDLARFGQLFLDQGRWGDKQLIPAGWVEASTAEQITGDRASLYAGFGYGYQWWRFRDFDPMVSVLQTNDVYFAYGDGGQLIMVVPHLELVVVSTANLVGDDFVKQFELIRDHVFAAVAN